MLTFIHEKAAAEMDHPVDRDHSFTHWIQNHQPILFKRGRVPSEYFDCVVIEKECSIVKRMTRIACREEVSRSNGILLRTTESNDLPVSAIRQLSFVECVTGHRSTTRRTQKPCERKANERNWPDWRH